MISVWRDGAERAEFGALGSNAKTDVLIVGGGIAGILTAYFLHEAGVPYILLEKGRICTGTTANTTAKITYQHGLIYQKLIEDIGVEGARAYLWANCEAAEKYAQMCRDIDCDYEVRDNYVYSIGDRRKLEGEMRALEKIGYGAKFCETTALPIETAGAVCFERQAQFHPLKFLFHISRGLNIYENTHVRDIDGRGAVGDFGRVDARCVVVATHFPFIDRRGMYFAKLYQHRSYVIALDGVGDVGGMYVDESGVGLSYRNYRNLLLLGGGAHRTGKYGGGYDKIRRAAKEQYPNATGKYCWATQDCMSLDGIPYIGRYSKHTPNMYVAGGFNKWGMTGGMVAAMLLCDMITGKSNEYAEIFSPSRSMLKPQLLVNGIETAKNILSLSPKRCSHLGCALKYNTAEKTWDCACHGSRFDESGNVLDNPANRKLKKHGK